MKRLTLFLGMLLTILGIEAKITLPVYFSDHMVLQQKSVVRFHGTASPMQEVRIVAGWQKQPVAVTADASGHWQVDISTPKAGGPYDISVSDDEELVLHDVLIGEVWLYAGEDHACLPLDYTSLSRVRLLPVQSSIALVPQTALPAATSGWKEISSETGPLFPSTAYFFASQLQKALKVPVGVVCCTWANTPIEAWSSYEALERVPGYEQHTEMLSSLGFHPEKIEAAYASQREAWYQDLYTHDMGWCDDHQVWAEPGYKDDSWKGMELPGAWEERGLADFDGVVWFRKTVDIPRSWHRKTLTLDLGPVADEDIVFFNGAEIGRGKGNAPRQYTIPRKWVRRGKAVLTIRVTNYAQQGGVLGTPEAMKLSTKGKEPISLSGEWKYLSGLSLDGIAPAPVSPSRDPNFPTGLYNAMIHPLTSFPIQGVVWNQGVSNLESLEEYADLQLSLIADWRDKWHNPALPFVWVQVGNHGQPAEHPEDSDWALLREAQAASLAMNRTAMVVTTDLPVASASTASSSAFETGFRLSQSALKQAYGKKRLPESPSYLEHRIEGNTIRLRWKGLGRGFVSSTVLRGFTVAGSDRVFYPAKATLDKKEVVVSAPEVPHPVAVRYNWADVTDGTLFGTSGLPVIPFRTDSW